MIYKEGLIFNLTVFLHIIVYYEVKKIWHINLEPGYRD